MPSVVTLPSLGSLHLLGAVVSSGAPDERLDVGAALDQGRRLFSLDARY